MSTTSHSNSKKFEHVWNIQMSRIRKIQVGTHDSNDMGSIHLKLFNLDICKGTIPLTVAEFQLLPPTTLVDTLSSPWNLSNGRRKLQIIREEKILKIKQEKYDHDLEESRNCINIRRIWFVYCV